MANPFAPTRDAGGASAGTMTQFLKTLRDMGIGQQGREPGRLTPDGDPSSSYATNPYPNTSASQKAQKQVQERYGNTATSSGKQSQLGRIVATGATPAASPTTNQAAGATASATGEATKKGAGQVNPDTTGFGALFDTEALNDAWSDPEALIAAYLQFAGRPTDTPGAAMTQQFADNLALLWLLENNFSTNDTVGTQDYLNWSGGYLDRIRTPGADTLTPRQIWETIMNPGDESVLYQNLYGPGLSHGDQVDSFLRTVRYGLEPYVPALMLDAQLNRANHLAQQYRAEALTGGDARDMSFNEYLQSQGFMR